MRREALDLDDIQGLVVRGYAGLRYATYLMLQIGEPVGARALLRRWAGSEVTAARRAPTAVAVNVALTSVGIGALTGARELPPGFSEPFASGMVTAYRSRLLGDVGSNDPQRWVWGGPSTGAVHLAVLVYAVDPPRLRREVGRLTAQADRHGMRVLTTLETERLTDREPFGFRDGISQPVLAGLPRAQQGGDVVRDGEFVLGYVNEYGQRTERPVLSAGADPERVLPRDPDGSRGADLGRNGSYLVFRQLRQDVDGFEQYLRRASTVDGGDDASRRERLAAKLVGRWRGSGASLTLAPDHDDPAAADTNDFGYHDRDRLGYGCPIGAHVRRANPRDALPPDPGTTSSLEVNRRHRLLRRGRAYGGDDAAVGGERGLHFLCLNTNLARQYEFVQHSWLNDPSFNGLVGVEDPVVGPRVDGPADFVEPADPVRRRHHDLPQFVQVKGGAYFFLPGIRALRFLASGPAWT